ncbi:ATP-binding protein [Streptomyces sp. NBC_01210]|uniref:ATP-binding protein n=1 Tax=Streptomyces sp. NBC_01210 TaxID=2903774 RepID=UPI002E143D3B|nr:ATP-binding protein [Streptomyces sp. NBC_01210]
MGDTVLKTMTTSGDGPDREREAAVRPLDGKAHDSEDELREFAAQFSSTPRGARLARRLTVRSMDEWGHPAASDVSCTVALLVGELATNAVRHGRVPGRDFRLRLSSDARRCLIRIEVSDASSEQPPTSVPTPCSDDESGRGLLLVDVLAARWGVTPRVPVGKTIWAEVAVEAPGR